MIRLLLATKNPGKKAEFQELLSPTPHIQLLSLSDLPEKIETPRETGSTFLDNARIKSQYYSVRYAGYVLAEDSGLEVSALGGRPGVFSARYAGEGASAEENIEKLRMEMGNIQDRRARFVAVFFLSRRGRELGIFRGEVEGEILSAPRGKQGFGYDPLFYYPPLRRSFGELSSIEKNRVSHRAIACRQLLDFFLHARY